MSNAPKDSKQSTKDKAAAARAAAEAEQRRRDLTIRLVGGGLIALAVIAILFFAVKGSANNAVSTGGTGTEIVADAAIPAGTADAKSATPWGVQINTAAGKPTLAIWEDFQCPICGEFDKANAATLEKWASDGKVNLVWRVATFIDKAPSATGGPNPNSSYRASKAYGCAIDAKQGEGYRNLVFANQPPTEGNGWTDEQLLGFGKTVGITGDAYTTFEKCYTDSTYGQWVTNSAVTFQNDAVPGTPTAYLNGTEVPTQTLNDMTALEKLISETPAA
jgi:protein-disulfide isomerase